MTATPVWSHELHRDGGVSVVSLRGELDIAASDTLRDLLLQEFDTPDTRRVTVDMAGVTFIDSTALSALVRAHSYAHDRGGVFSVINVGRTVRRVFEVTGLYDIFTSVPESTI